MVLLWNEIKPSILNLPQPTYAYSCCRLTTSRDTLTNFAIFRNSLGRAVSGLYSDTNDMTFILFRLNTLKLLFRIILDVINPSFIVEDRQWQPSTTVIFYSYFTALWKDPQVLFFRTTTAYEV